ncbi:hypothetical protein SprV_0802621000 [Sparganum proliferum]
MDRGDSRLETMPRSLADVTGNNVLAVTPPEHCVIPTLISTAERFFYALFTDPGISALPHSLCIVIRDFYLLLRREFPQQPSKNHMKYVGLNLLFRYLNSVVIAPDAFGLLLPSKDAKSTVDGDSSHLLSDPESRTNSRLERNQRRRLTALSRLLLFVIANKGFSTRPPPDARCISPRLQQSQEFGRIINPLIRVWHTKFRTYFKDIVDMTEPTTQNFRPVVRPDASALWIQSLPGMSQVGGCGGAASLGSYASAMVNSISSHPLEPKTTVSLAVEELVEIHRLLLTYQWKIAPNASDPLHAELQKLPPVPEICPQDGGTGDQLVPATASPHTTVNNHQKQTLELAKLGTPDGSLLAAASLLLTPPKIGGNPATEDSSLCSKDTSLRRPQKRYFRFHRSPEDCRGGQLAEEGSFILPAEQHLLLTLEASDISQISGACLYAAGAACVRCTDCFTFAHRPCHPCSRRQAEDCARLQRLVHSCQTDPRCFFKILAGIGAGRGWGARSRPEIGREGGECSGSSSSSRGDCLFCVFERVSLPWCQPAAFVFGWASSQPPVPVIVTSDSPAPYVAFAIGKKNKPAQPTGGPAQAISQDFGKDWITAKEQLSFLMRWTALQKYPAKERPPWYLKGSSSVHLSEWLCLLRSWVVRQQLELNSRKKHQSGGNLATATGSGGLWQHGVSTGMKTSLMDLGELDLVSEERESMLNGLQRRLDVLQSSLDRIHETKCGQPMSIWHDLLSALARDIFHLRSPCRRVGWSSITGKLGSIMNVLEMEVRHRRHTVSVFSNFLEACLTPTVKNEKRPAFGLRSETVAFSASSSLLLKCGILLAAPDVGEKHLRGIRLEIECMPASPAPPQQQQQRSTRPGVLCPPACAAGRFAVRTFLYGVSQSPQAAELRLAELLHMQDLGQRVYTLPPGLELALEPLIDLLIKKFYTDPGK